MTLFSSSNHIVKSVGRVALIILLSCIVGACHDEDMVDAVQGADTDGSLTFTVEVPGYVVPTRAAGQVSIDEEITTLSLFLFDEKGGFMGIVDAEKKDGASIDSGEKDDIYDTDLLNGQGAYQASIPQNTEVVHFIANAPAEFLNLDINRYKGLRAEEVIAPMVTTEQVYWGTSTYADLQQKTFDQEPVILYRNYAKVTWQWEAPAATVADDDADAEALIVSIDGWTLCNKPQNATVAPFDADAIGETKGPFHFNLADANSRYTCVPMADELMELADGAEDEMVTEGLPQPLPLFDHTTEAYGNKRVFAIFKIKTKRGTDNKTQFYKIELLKDTKENGIVVHREPYDIKRNHIYTINIKGINPDLGKSTFTAAAEGPAANNTLVEVEETLPELQSNTSVLRVENGTVRYIDNLATKYTTTATATIDGTEYTAYNVNDIQIYYNGPYGITAEWVTDSCHYSDGNSYVPETSTDATLKLQLKEQQDVYGRFTHIVSFYADAFAEGDNSTRRYKEGLIRIRETGAGALSRFVRVYIGNPISFRPLLISSDIPAMTDERLTVAFTVPDEDYLPSSLYPIEVRFGSDRIDVEKNLYVDAMKVDLVSTAYEDNLLQYTNVVDDVTLDQWGWYANGEADDSWKDWGYKYTYTIEEPADSGEHRITLRTVSNETTDFSVVMEGLSTVLLNGTRSTDEANIFNTRELRFKVQPETTNAEARRIMLNNGLVDTRLVTAYINNLKGNNSVSIPYTLGQFNPEDAANGYMTQATTIDAQNPVTLWVYYRPDDLIPGTWATLNNGVPFVDAEGNSFATVTAKAATGTLDFTIKNSNLKNSLVFITARSGMDDNTGKHPYGSTYTGEALGKPSHVYTGVNADAQAYRSASALVSVLSNWKFNPAVKNEEGTFEYADVYEKKYGTQSTMDTYDFPVRIDRPSGNAATIQIDTEGKLQLIEFPDSPYDLTEGTYEIVTDNTTQEELYRRSIGSTISLTLKAEASNQCELTFRPLTFDHSCTITFTNGTGSTIYDESEKNTLEVTHTPIAIYSNKYMWLDEYEAGISNESVDDALFSSSLNVDPVIGQEYVVRIYFLKDDIAAVFTEEPDAFTFKFSSNCSEVQSPNTKSKTDNYQILADGSIQVNQGFKNPLTIDGKQYGYVDLILKTTKAASSETMRISTAESPATLNGKTAANPIKFYRYSVSGFGNRTIYETGSSDVKYELSTDKTEWVEIEHNGTYFNTDENLADLYKYGQKVYLRVTLPADSEGMEFTLASTGLTGGANNIFTPSEKNAYVLEMNTTGYGIAEKITLSGESKTAVVKEQTFTLATKTETDYYPWSIFFTGAGFHNTEDKRSGDGHLIFDMNDQYIEQTIGDYTVAAKINNSARISFYAPYPNMMLTLGAAVKNGSTEAGAFTIYYDGNEDNVVNEGGAVKINGTEVQGGSRDNDKTAVETGGASKITELTYELGQAGLYHLKRYGNKEFPLYYINIEKSRTASNAPIISLWCAKKSDDSQMANATWGGTGAALIDGNLIYLSDFAEKLVLAVNAELPEDNLTLYLPTAGKYAFKSGDQKVFELSGLTRGTTVELVPASDTEIVEGTDIIQLTGYSNNYTYSQNITVKVIPWVQLSTNLYEKYKTTNSAGYPIMQVGDTVQTEFVLTDAQHVGKDLKFGIQVYNNNTYLNLESNGGYDINKAELNAFSTFVWRAVTATTRGLFQIRGFSTTSGFTPTDVMYNGAFLADGWKTQLFDLEIRGASITYSMGTNEGVVGQLPADVIIKESEMTDGSYKYTLPKNFTLYKEGSTLTGWKYGTTIYEPGAELIVSSNVTLTPVFTANSVSLTDRTEPVTITWDFQRNNGAPIVGWSGTDGHVWVAQAEVTVGSTTKTIDVKMDVNTTAFVDGYYTKFNNSGNEDCTQINGGTIFTIPSCSGASVEMECHASFTISTTTIDGSTDYDSGSETTKITETVTNTADNIEIVIGDGSFYKYLTVTLPVVESLYTVTYYNEGYTTSDVTYTQFEQQTYGDGDVIVLPGSYPSDATHWATCSKTTSYGYDVEQKTQIKGGESVNADMHIYPVWPVTVSATSATVSAEHVYHAEGCYTRKVDNQLIDSSSEGDYILFDIVPNESGTYMFTAPIGTQHDNMKVTLGYVNANGEFLASEQLTITNNGIWESGNNYSWIFNLTAGTTYTFKMTCDTGSNTCVNVFDMTVKKITTDVYEWYVNETPAVVTLKNGETTTEVFTTTGADGNMQANASATDPVVTLANGNNVTLTRIMKIGSGQSVTLQLPYKMKLTILWETRGNNDANNYPPKEYCIKITGNETITVEGNGDMSSQTEKTTYQNELTLDRGTWKIERKGGQPFLYYLKLEPQ